MLTLTQPSGSVDTTFLHHMRHLFMFRYKFRARTVAACHEHYIMCLLPFTCKYYMLQYFTPFVVIEELFCQMFSGVLSF